MKRHAKSFLLASILLSASCEGRSSLDMLTAGIGGTPSFGDVTVTGGTYWTSGMNATGGSTTFARTSTDGTPSTGDSASMGGNKATGGTTASAGTLSTGGSTNTKLIAKTISSGFNHTCALTDNSVQCWGDNSVGELGNGTTTDSSVPVTVSGVTGGPLIAIAAGYAHTCALFGRVACGYKSCSELVGGTVQCWGDNRVGELGNGTTTGSSVPVPVYGISDAVAIAAGNLYTCAVLSSGTVQCWGDNRVGELGNGTTTGGSVPVTVSGITNATAVAAGYGQTCAVLSSGTVQCWGDNSVGELGNGTTTGSSVPVTVSGITNAVVDDGNYSSTRDRDIAAGNLYTCAVLSSGTVQCWGDNSVGELGNGTTTGSSVPVTVSGITNATAVAAGYDHTCAVLTDGTVRCWGDNTVGELGNGTTTGSSVPVTVSGVWNCAAAVAAGYAHTCAVLDTPVFDHVNWYGNGNSVLVAGGTAQCWGDNSVGELGNGTTTSSSVPVTVSGF